MTGFANYERMEGRADARLGREPAIDRWLSRNLGNSIHLFLSLLAVLILVAAGIATWDVIVRDFPRLLQPVSEYSVLQDILQTILLIAIAAELGLLLLFHRATAAVEVIIFVIARKMVRPDITVTGLLMGTVSIIALVITRHYYLPGKSK
jgi:hypothetical protein